jgi:hypothetical protein
VRKLYGVLFVTALIVAGCGGGEGNSGGSIDDPSLADASSQDTQDSSTADDSTEAGSSGGGSQDSPMPEGSAPLPPDSIRIGETVWERTMLDSGQCFVQEDEGAIPFAVWGNLNNDEELRFSVSDNSDTGAYEAEVSSQTMGWIAGTMDGTELTVEWDIDSQTINGEGLFYNIFEDAWAYGSFGFDCNDE